MTTKYITRNKDILDGQPVITGTRIPVERVMYLRKRGYTEARLTKEFSLSMKKVHGLIDELATIGWERIDK